MPDIAAPAPSDGTARPRLRRHDNGATKPAAPVPVIDADAIAEAIAASATHVQALKQGIQAQDKVIARAEEALANATPRQKPALEDELRDLKAARDNARQVLVKAEEQLEDALKRHKQAERDACGLSGDVVPRVGVIAKSVQDSLRSAADGIREMFAEADAIKVLGIEIRSYANRAAILSAMHAAGLAEFANLPPAHDPKALPQAVEMWGFNVSQRKGQLRQPKDER